MKALTKKVNWYHIYDESNYSAVLYRAIATNEEQVRELAEQNNIDLTGLTIELVRVNVKNELGKPYAPSIKDAIVR